MSDAVGCLLGGDDGCLLGDLDGCFVGKGVGGEVGSGLGGPVSCSGIMKSRNFEGIVDGGSEEFPALPGKDTLPEVASVSSELRLRVKLPLLLVDDDQLPQFGSKAEVEGLGVASRLSFASRLNNIGMTTPV